MIQKPEGEISLSHGAIRAIALFWLQRQAWAASEDPALLGDILGPTVDTPGNRQRLAKTLEGLGRQTVQPLTEKPDGRSTTSAVPRTWIPGGPHPGAVRGQGGGHHPDQPEPT